MVMAERKTHLVFERNDHYTACNVWAGMLPVVTSSEENLVKKVTCKKCRKAALLDAKV